MTEKKTKRERPVYSGESGDTYVDKFLAEKPQQESDKAESLKDRVVDALRQIYDPEIPVNIYDLGLIYDIEVDDNAKVVITMTLTTPHCPVAESMPSEVELRASYVEGVQDAEVNLVWDPPWDPSKMSEEAKLELGFL